MSNVPAEVERPYASNEQEEAPGGGAGRRLWRDWIRPFGLVLLVVVSFRSTVVDWNHVPSDSMEPTIVAGDRIVVNKLAYDLRLPLTRIRLAKWDSPRRGDLVVFLSPMDRRRLVKRVVGLPGDRIVITEGRLELNGREARYEPLEAVLPDESEPESAQRPAGVETLARERLEPGIDHPVRRDWEEGQKTSFGPLTVAENGYFVLGDNRDHSFDSRNFGLVRSDLILGKATAIALSVDRDAFYRPRWQRFFTRLP
jgi:signal peptidase I